MPGAQKCPVCGAELPGDLSGGECVQCLLRLGLNHAAENSGETSLPAGTKVEYFGDYLLLHEIARGGNGVVYKARQHSLNRVVALKMILSGQLADEAEVRRFHTEAEAAANLSHANIVPIYEIGEHQGRHYFSMEFIEGANLAAKLGDRGWKMEERVRLLCMVAWAVHHAHQRGIIHRDLKPSNILVDSQGQPHVTDFGLARRMEGEGNLTQSGLPMGTPSYMAPEQVLGRTKQMTTCVDVWALGVILYELLTHRLPFKAETRQATWGRILDDEPQRPSSINSKIDRDLETICLKCLEKEPDRRFASAGELASELERRLHGEPILARPVSAPERTWRWCRRHPARTGLVVALVLAFNLGLLGVWQWRRSSSMEEELRQFKLRAQQGDPRAQTHLGDLYYKGQGVKRDYAQAAVWYRMAAEQGLPEAQLKLGLLHHLGRGVALNPTQAATWYAKSTSSPPSSLQTTNPPTTTQAALNLPQKSDVPLVGDTPLEARQPAPLMLAPRFPPTIPPKRPLPPTTNTPPPPRTANEPPPNRPASSTNKPAPPTNLRIIAPP